MTGRRIYLASSWRNEAQPALVQALRAAGHEVYDFRNPAEGQDGFAWSAIDRDWLGWKPDRFAELLRTHPVAQAGYQLDKDALDWCDTCVLLLPCGRSAHLEAGYAIGQGKQTIILLADKGFEPELMYLMADAVVTEEAQLFEILSGPVARPDRPEAILGTIMARLVDAASDEGMEIDCLEAETILLDNGLVILADPTPEEITKHQLDPEGGEQMLRPTEAGRAYLAARVADAAPKDAA